MAKNWTEEEIKFLHENIGKKMTPEQVAMALNKSETAVRLFCSRHRINIRKPIERPIMVAILRIKFGEPEYFKPTRDFYRKVQINQKRFSLLRCGYVQPTENEIKAVCQELKMNHEEYAALLDARQLNLFNDYEQNS